MCFVKASREDLCSARARSMQRCWSRLRENLANQGRASAKQKSQCQSFRSCSIDPNSLVFIPHRFLRAAAHNSSSAASKANKPCDNSDTMCIITVCVYHHSVCIGTTVQPQRTTQKKNKTKQLDEVRPVTARKDGQSHCDVTHWLANTCFET